MAIFGFLKLGTKTKKGETVEEKRRSREAEYYKIIDEAARNETNFEIAYATTEHSAYVLKTIFRYAQDEVCIYTPGFNEAIFDDEDLILEAIKFLNKHETKLKIAYKASNSDDVLSGKFLKSVLNVITAGKVEVWNASKATQINDSYFWLNDRYCFAIGPQNPKANFGNKEIGQNLANLFIRIIIKSEKVLG